MAYPRRRLIDDMGIPFTAHQRFLSRNKSERLYAAGKNSAEGEENDDPLSADEDDISDRMSDIEGHASEDGDDELDSLTSNEGEIGDDTSEEDSETRERRAHLEELALARRKETEARLVKEAIARCRYTPRLSEDSEADAIESRLIYEWELDDEEDDEDSQAESDLEEGEVSQTAGVEDLQVRNDLEEGEVSQVQQIEEEGYQAQGEEGSQADEDTRPPQAASDFLEEKEENGSQSQSASDSEDVKVPPPKRYRRSQTIKILVCDPSFAIFVDRYGLRLEPPSHEHWLDAIDIPENDTEDEVEESDAMDDSANANGITETEDDGEDGDAMDVSGDVTEIPDSGDEDEIEDGASRDATGEFNEVLYSDAEDEIEDSGAVDVTGDAIEVLYMDEEDEIRVHNPMFDYEGSEAMDVDADDEESDNDSELSDLSATPEPEDPELIRLEYERRVREGLSEEREDFTPEGTPKSRKPIKPFMSMQDLVLALTPEELIRYKRELKLGRQLIRHTGNPYYHHIDCSTVGWCNDRRYILFKPPSFNKLPKIVQQLSDDLDAEQAERQLARLLPDKKQCFWRLVVLRVKARLIFLSRIAHTVKVSEEEFQAMAQKGSQWHLSENFLSAQEHEESSVRSTFGQGPEEFEVDNRYDAVLEEVEALRASRAENYKGTGDEGSEEGSEEGSQEGSEEGLEEGSEDGSEEIDARSSSSEDAAVLEWRRGRSRMMPGINSISAQAVSS